MKINPQVLISSCLKLLVPLHPRAALSPLETFSAGWRAWQPCGLRRTQAVR